jgi:hypothetical protein
MCSLCYFFLNMCGDLIIRSVGNMDIVLPVELWHHIALIYSVDGIRQSHVYRLLSLVNSKFIISTPILKEHYIRKICRKYKTEYRLPNNDLHSPNYGMTPAVINKAGTQFWHRDGKVHREGDLPAIVSASGSTYWYYNGKRHRNDKPAIISATSSQWWIHGVQVRSEHRPC